MLITIANNFYSASWQFNSFKLYYSTNWFKIALNNFPYLNRTTCQYAYALGECPSFNRCAEGRPLRAIGRLCLCASDWLSLPSFTLRCGYCPARLSFNRDSFFRLRVCGEAPEAGPQSGRERSYRALHGQLWARLQPLWRQKRSWQTQREKAEKEKERREADSRGRKGEKTETCKGKRSLRCFSFEGGTFLSVAASPCQPHFIFSLWQMRRWNAYKIGLTLRKSRAE